MSISALEIYKQRILEATALCEAVRPFYDPKGRKDVARVWDHAFSDLQAACKAYADERDKETQDTVSTR